MPSVKPNLGNSFSQIYFWLLFAASFTCCGAADVQIKIPPSGVYWDGAAKIGNDGKTLTGLIDTFIGDSSGGVCQFYFDGKIAGKKFEVNCGNFVDTGTVVGTVTILNDSTIFLKTKEGPGCSERVADFVQDGATFILKNKLPLIQIRSIKSEKAFFYSKPDSSTKRKAYLVHGNEAQVTESQDGWLKVTFKKTSGWMREKDMIQLHSKNGN